jgi:hypothetical protein
MFFLLVIGLLCTSMFAQTPKAIPYMTSLWAGVANENVATNAYTPGQVCPSGLTATDEYGDGCLATEGILFTSGTGYAQIVFDSIGNAYFVDYDPSGNFSVVHKVDAVTGVMTLFAGGLSSAAGSGTTPCDGYTNGTHTGSDPAVNSLLYANKTAGDGCPAVDPVTFAPYTYFKGIRDIAIDANYLYIADSSNSKVRKVSLSDTTARPYAYYPHECEPVAGFGGSGWSQDGSLNTVAIKNIYSVVVDTAGNVFFGDQSGNAIRRATPTTYSLVGGVWTPTVGSVLTILNCVSSGSTCVAPSGAASGCPGTAAGLTPPGTTASKNLKAYTVTGMAFDSSGNLYAAETHCYSVYKIANNGANPIDGTTLMSTLMGNGATGSYSGGSWMQAYSGGAQSSSRAVASAGNGNLYIINGQSAWFYDSTDTANGATNGWIHQFFNNSSSVGTGCSIIGTAGGTPTYYGCPAQLSEYQKGKGNVDQYGNLYIVDNANNVVLKAATGLDFEGVGPEVTTTGSATQPALIHGAGINDSDVSVTSGPFSIAPLLSYGGGTTDCSTYTSVSGGNQTDNATDCTYSVTFTPTPPGGVETGTLSANGTNLKLDGLGGAAAPSLTAGVSCLDKVYDGTTNSNGCVCSLTPSESNVSCGASMSCSFASANAANGITVTCTGITLGGSAASGFTLSNSTATTTNNIDQATPVLSASCPGGVYNGAPYSCTGAATGVGGATVAGTFSCVPGSETNAGSYPEVCTFTSGDPNYVSGGTASSTLTITQASPTLTVTCPEVTYDGNAHSCTGSATGVGGAAVAGTFAFVPGSETNAGSYPETGTFTSSDTNYASGGTATGTLIINPATPVLAISCPTVTYDGNPHSCTASATGVAGAGGALTKVRKLIQIVELGPTVSGTFSCVPASETNAGTYPVTCTFTSSDPNYVSGGTVSGSLVINPATPTLSLTCTSVVANGNPQACSPGGSATGIGGGAVTGSWTYTYNGSSTVPSAPATYTVVGTFTSSNPNYVSGGTATGSFVIGTEPTVAVTLSCPTPTYDGTAHSCTATPTPGTASCSGLVSETNAGTYPESVTCTNAGYLAGTATGSLVISPATPALSATCAGGVYNGTPNSCTGSATGVGGAAVTGSFAFAPGSETNAGSYPETGTFTSTNSNYVSGGTASATLVITAATPTLSLTCNSVTANGSPQACSPGGSATGVGGAAVSGTWTYTYNGSATVPSVAATYTVVGTFTSSNPNYVSGGTATGSFVINPVPTGTVSLTLSTTAVTFPGSIMIGQSSAAQYVLITSTGTSPLVVSGVTVGGANPGDFIVTNQAGTCTTGASLVNHAECNLRVVFAPTATGTRSAILFINDNASGSPQQVTVSGTAISGAQLTLSVTTLTFPSTTVGATAATQYITLKSTGFQPVVVNKVVLSSGDFDLSDQAGTCTTAATTSLVPGADCNIRVKFHPTATGARSATVVINSNSPASPQSVTLNGTGM